MPALEKTSSSFPLCFDSLIKTNVAADRLHGRVELFLTPARHEDVGIPLRRKASRGEAYSFVATGNDRPNEVPYSWQICLAQLAKLTLGHRRLTKVVCRDGEIRPLGRASRLSSLKRGRLNSWYQCYALAGAPRVPAQQLENIVWPPFLYLQSKQFPRFLETT